MVTFQGGPRHSCLFLCWIKVSTASNITASLFDLIAPKGLNSPHPVDMSDNL